LSQCGPKSSRDYLRFGRGEYKWWREKYVVTAGTIDTSLRRVRQNVLSERGLTDFFRNVFFARERFACGFVFYKFNAE
jgi:hypothetical protein